MNESFEVEIASQGWRFACAPDQTLLRAALAAGLQLAHSCRNGSCRSCICRLVAGRIEHGIEWPGLSAEEKAEGWILPCVALPRSPLRLAAVALRPGSQTADPSTVPVDKSVNFLRAAPPSG